MVCLHKDHITSRTKSQLKAIEATEDLLSLVRGVITEGSQVDVLAKPVIICSNAKPCDDSWIARNFFVVEMKESLVEYPSTPSAPEVLATRDTAEAPANKKQHKLTELEEGW